MDSSGELEQIKARVLRIEAELADTRRQLADVERRFVSPSGLAVPASRPAEAPPLLPPPLPTVPPPLPPSPPVRPVAMPPTAPASPRPAPAAREFVPAEVAPTEPPAWREWLQRLQLWPPAGEGNTEVRLGAWWATRLGAFLAVIGIVLFGVYVSVNTPAWVKFAELLMISAGVTGAGLWLERRIPRFGAVVFAAGLALLYFCAFAGYTLPPVKVIAGITAAVAWQLAAVLVLTGAAVWRGSPTIATVAVGLGYVTALFSRSGGLHDFALCTAFLLAVVSVGFHRRLHWEAPAVLALPGTYAVYALVLHGNWLRGGAPSGGWAWGLLVAVVLLFFVRDWRKDRAVAEDVSAGERWFQGLNSSLGLLLGAVLALTLFRPHLAQFYFGAAALLGLLAYGRYRQVDGDVMGAVLLAKAAGAVTLGVIEVADGRTTAIALLVQAWVMMFSAARLGSRVLSVGTGAVAFVALAFFLRDATMPMAAASWTTLGAVGFVLGFVLLASEAARRVVSAGVKVLLESVGAIAAGGAGLVAVGHWRPDGWLPAFAVALAALLGVAAVVRRAWGPALAAGFLLAAAHFVLWGVALLIPGDGWLLKNALIVLVPTIALGAWLGGRKAVNWGVFDARLGARFGTTAWAAAVLGAVLVIFNVGDPLHNLVLTLAMALGLAGLAPALSSRHLPWLATWAVVLGLICWQGRAVMEAPTVWLVAAVSGAWLLPVGLRALSGHRLQAASEPQAGAMEALQVAMATWVTIRALPWIDTGAPRVALMALAATIVFTFVRWPGISSALVASWVIWVMGLLATIGLQSPAWPLIDLFRLALAALLAWIPAVMLVRMPAATEAAWWRRQAAGLQTAIAVLMALRLSAVGYSGAAEIVALGVSVGVAVLMLRAAGLTAARTAAVVLIGWAWADAFALALTGGAEGPGAGLAVGFALAVGVMALPLAIAGEPQALAQQERRRLHWLAGAAGLALAFVLATVQRGVLAPYATVGWGGAAILLFGAGLFARIRPYRMLGLVGLLLCIPRVFLVDLQSAFHRIIAFVVLGVVLLWVGFSYHRFRHLVVEAPSEEDKS